MERGTLNRERERVGWREGKGEKEGERKRERDREREKKRKRERERERAHESHVFSQKCFSFVPVVYEVPLEALKGRHQQPASNAGVSTGPLQW